MVLLHPTRFATGNITHSFITPALHQTGGLSGAENIDGGDERRLLHNGETRSVSTYQFIFLHQEVHRIAEGDPSVRP